MMNDFLKNFDYQKIQEEFDKIVKESGVELGDDLPDDVRDILNLDFSEFSKEFEDLYKSKYVQIKLLNERAVFPKYAYGTDSGFDLHSTEQVTIPPFGRALIPTGISVSFDEGLELQIRPKSGLAINMGLTVLNTPGTIDQGYTGEIMVIVFNTNSNAVIIEKGMKIAQGVFCPVLQGKFIKFEGVDEFEIKDRGANGFGSTGI